MSSRKMIMSLLVLFLICLSLVPNPVSGQGEITNQSSNTLITDQYQIYLPGISKPILMTPPDNGSWPMVAANSKRTSWTPTEVSGNLNVVWYRPIEAYIPQNVQIIAEYGNLYISTAKGLYVLNATDGSLVWRFDTELPLGNSPTVINGVVYVGGHDHKLHALDAINGTHLWAFEGAEAGFDTNPLVVEGKVIAGNRDGYMYAIAANGQANQGQLLWKFKTGGPIHFSAAYNNGVVYFASDDNFAYAIQVSAGTLLWKSEKMPGDGYHSYWPVIYRDKVIFSASIGYRLGINPGMGSIIPTPGSNYDTYPTYRHMEVEDILPGQPAGTKIGQLVADQEWANGYPVIDGSNVTEYFENDPNSNPNKHKPWRRTFIMLNQSDGSEYTFDSDQDGNPEYLPAGYWGTNSGNRYPPVVGADGKLYFNALYEKSSDSQGRVMGWNFGTQYLSIIGGQGATAEPQAISTGGNVIYRNLCCDRVGDYFSITTSGPRNGSLWSYNLSEQAPGYDAMWVILEGWPRLHGWYQGNTDSVNSAYHNHGDQNPIIPYQGHLYVHRSNAIIAYGNTPVIGEIPLITIQPAQDQSNLPTVDDLKLRLEDEISKIVDAGHLRPGYMNSAQFMYNELADYFDNPGDTLYTLSIAYPYLSSQLQDRLRIFLQQEFQDYFNPTMYASIGWAQGAPREAMPLPPEVEAALVNHPKSERAGGFLWNYPQHNIYAMWRYAQIFPEQAGQVYELAKSKLQVPVPDNFPIPLTEWFQQRPFELNAFMAGYIGFLNLQLLAGKGDEDVQLRLDVTAELDHLYQLKIDLFSKDSYWKFDNFRYSKQLDISRNFIYLVPELGNFMNQNLLAKVTEAINEYTTIAPYWFVSRFESAIGETAITNLYSYPALFQAKAFILKEPYEELVKYLDVPAFERGDLFYIQNLVAAIEAP